MRVTSAHAACGAGYFARVAAVDAVVNEICGGDGRTANDLQVVVLGAGMETLYFRLHVCHPAVGASTAR